MKKTRIYKSPTVRAVVKKPIDLVVVYSDLHCGSEVAICPPNLDLAGGGTYGLNGLQKFFWECWQDVHLWRNSIVGSDPFAVVINGDAIEGDHHGTSQLVSKKLSDHISAAVQLLDPVVKDAEKRFMVSGTECHTGDLETAIGGLLKCEQNPDTKRANFSFDRLTLDVHGVRCVFRHHIGTTTRRSLNASQLSANLAEEQVEAANNGETMPRVLGCAHRHVFSSYANDNGTCFVTPPWQALTRFAHKVVSASRTKPGLVILDWRGLPIGASPRVHSQVYKTPPAASFSL